MTAIKKKKHVSKKNKKDWRKHCDIRDVEDFLDDQRLEERLGKFEAKPDSELFVVDTAGVDAKPEEDVKPLPLRLRKRQKLNEPPKCFQVLIPDSKVQDPNAKRNHVNPIGAKPTALSKVSDKRKLEKGVFKRKLDEARSNRKIALDKKRKNKKQRQTFELDMWGSDVPSSKTIPSTLVDDFISPEAQLHNVLTEQRLRPKPPLSKTVATRKAIDIPHPGVSYNPSFKEHQDLLQEVVVHEQRMMKKESHLLRVTTGMFRKVTPQQKETQWLEEMSTGLPTPHNPQADSDSESEYKAINPPVRNKKKDHKARRKQKERLAEMERRKREKIDKKKITDIYKLRKLQSSISTREQKQATLRDKRAEKRAVLSATALPELNAHKAPEKQPDFVEVEQLKGDLRSVSNNTNLLRDRFESLQRRGALAASKVMMKKKRKVKSYFKPGHKVTDQEIERYVNRNTGKK